MSHTSETRHYAYVSIFRRATPVLPPATTLNDTTPIGLAHALTSPNRASRNDATGAIEDVVKDLSSDDVALLVRVLVAARVVEEDSDCQEAELHALADLKEWHPIPVEALARLRYLPSESAVGSQIEYLDYLLGDSA